MTDRISDQIHSAKRHRRDPNEVWCRKNVTPQEFQEFWDHWGQTQWGMPTFAHLRLSIEARRRAIQVV